MEENTGALEADAFNGQSRPIEQPARVATRHLAGAANPTTASGSRPETTYLSRSRRPLARRFKPCPRFSISFASAAPTRFERVRRSGELRYGSDMEGGGPYAYPDPASPRGHGRLRGRADGAAGRGPGRQRRSSRRASGTSCSRYSTRAGSTSSSTATSGPSSAARDYLATRPYYVYQLAVDGAARQSDPELGRPEETEARRRPMDGRRARRLGSRYVRRRARRPARRGRPLRRRHRRDDGRRRTASTTRRSRTFPPPGSIAIGSRPRAGRPARVARLLCDLRPERGPGAPRRTRPEPGQADRLGRAAAALREIRDLDRGPERARRRSRARSRWLPAARGVRRLGAPAPVSIATCSTRPSSRWPFRSPRCPWPWSWGS